MSWTVSITTVTINLEYAYLNAHKEPDMEFYDNIVDKTNLNDSMSATFDDYEQAKAYMLSWYGHLAFQRFSAAGDHGKANCTFYRGGRAVATIINKYTVPCKADMLMHAKITLKNDANNEDLKLFNEKWKDNLCGRHSGPLFDNYPEEFDKYWLSYDTPLEMDKYEKGMPTYEIKPHIHSCKAKKSKKDKS